MEIIRLGEKDHFFYQHIKTKRVLFKRSFKDKDLKNTTNYKNVRISDNPKSNIQAVDLI